MLGRGWSLVLPRAACAHVRQWQMASRLRAALFPALPLPRPWARPPALPPSLCSTAQAWPRGRLRVGAQGAAGQGGVHCHRRARDGWSERGPKGLAGAPASQWGEWRGEIEVVRDAAALATVC